MATVRIGTKRIAKGVGAEPDEPADAAYTVQWVELNGLRLASGDYGILRATWTGSAGVHEVTITFTAGDFTVVDEAEGLRVLAANPEPKTVLGSMRQRQEAKRQPDPGR